MSVEQLSKPRIDQQNHYFDDTTTWLAEVLDGSMRTSFEYTFDGNELYSRNSEALEPIFVKAIWDARNISDKNPNLLFELRRRYIEKSEYEDMLLMAQGKAPNTMVVVSDFPPELMDANEDIGGYNTARKTTMLRIITKTKDGKLKVSTQSLAGSNRYCLEKIYEHLGFEPIAGELLGQRMHIELEPEAQDDLTDKLMNIYDQNMTHLNGGEFHAGIRGGKSDNTYDFVLKQNDLIDAYLRNYDTTDPIFDKQLYNLSAAIKYRHGDFTNTDVVGLDYKYHMDDANSEMQRAGEAARACGQTFSGCGASLRPSELDEAKNELFELGYGNKTNTESKYSFNKYMFCVVCQSPPDKQESKKMCGPCGICKPCDAKLKK